MVNKPTYEELEQKAKELEGEANERELLEEEWHSLMEYAPDLILKIDRNGKILFINRAFPGFTKEETIGKSVYEYIAPEHHEKTRKAIEQVFRTGDYVSFETIAAGPDGVPAWYSTHLGPIRSGGSIVAVAQISTDITEKKCAEKMLLESEEIYSTLVENAKEGIVIIQDNKIVYVNPVVEKLSPYSKDEIFSEAFPYFIHPDDRGPQEKHSEETWDTWKECKPKILPYISKITTGCGYIQ